MAVEYISTPLKTLGASTIRWMAIHNDVLFVVRRTDFLVTAATNSGGNTSLTIGAGGVASLTIGGRVWISLVSGQSGYYTIVSFTAGTIVITLPWVASSTGVVNLITDYTNYLLKATYQYSDDVGATWTDYSTSEHQMGTDFKATINVSPFLKSLVTSQSKMHPTATKNDTADYLDRLTRLVFTETFGSFAGDVSQSAHATEILYIANAAMQLQYANGVNLKEYLTNAVPTQTFKFITDFVKPTFFKDFPFALYFIYSELMTNGAIDANEEEFQGTTSISSANYVLDVTKIQHVNRYFLQEVTTSYGANSDLIKVKIKINAGANLSEILSVKYNNCVKRNPVYLKWLGKGGGWNYWLFHTNQEESVEVTSQGGEVSKYITDLSTADTDSDYLTKEATPEITCIADMLDVNDFNGLKNILHSPKVQMLMNLTTWESDASRDVWQTVKIKPSRYKLRDTKAANNIITFNMQLTELFIQTN